MTDPLIHPRLGEISLSQSRRARRISISVRASGAVRLSYPCGVSRKRALDFLEDKIEWIERARRRMAERTAAHPRTVPTAEEIEALRRRARTELPPRVEELARRFGFSYGKVSIRAARTKWGSCSSRNDLSLSLFMMILPEHLRDFVLLHELCHTVHHDHSARFHALLDQCVAGKEKLLSRELRSYSIR